MYADRTNLKRPKRRREIPDVTEQQVEETIMNLANGKAPDNLGLTAEHFKKWGYTVVTIKITKYQA